MHASQRVRSTVGSAHNMHACMPGCPSPWLEAGIAVLTNALHPLQDLPAILERQPELEHFAESVVFEDRLSPRLGLPAASCAGKEAYSRLCWSLRFHRTLFFSKAKVGGWVGGWVAGVLLFGVAAHPAQANPTPSYSPLRFLIHAPIYPPPLPSSPPAPGGAAAHVGAGARRDLRALVGTCCTPPAGRPDRPGGCYAHDPGWRVRWAHTVPCLPATRELV